MSSGDDPDLVPLRDPAHVEPYHDIRRRELFETYSPGRDYERNHAHEDLAQNLPHVLLLGGAVIGTIRIDLIDHCHAGLRLIAVIPEHRNRGVGAWMLARAEAIALGYGRSTIVINSAIPARRFYERHGYRVGAWHDVLALNPEHTVRLGKVLQP